MPYSHQQRLNTPTISTVIFCDALDLGQVAGCVGQTPRQGCLLIVGLCLFVDQALRVCDTQTIERGDRK